jgi:NADPH-dependent 7-cyano-7-deazaguanine reductase QueF-like protein
VWNSSSEAASISVQFTAGKVVAYKSSLNLFEQKKFKKYINEILNSKIDSVEIYLIFHGF